MGDRGARMRSTLSDTFWILVLSIVVLFAFFIALGAFHPGDVAWLTLGVLALALLCAVHAAWDARHRTGRDPAAIRNRERRGF
jgi:prepilin signal peptidase PulO-like enzyme (type II secretory pathway)